MKMKIALISVGVNLILAFVKIIAGLLSNSAAVMAEGIHSGMDILSSAIGFIGIKTSKKPSDREHPYGHYKFEVLTGLIIVVILFATGVGIIYEAYESFFNPTAIVMGYLALGVMIFSAIINEVMSRVKIYYGKKESSVSLLSDGFHSRIDVYTSIAVLLGLVLSNYWIYADSLLAFLIGLYIIKQSFSLGKETIDSLLDVSAGKETEDKIKSIAKSKNIKIAGLKTQKKGSAITANLIINLPSTLSVEKATAISDSLKKELIKKINNLEYVAIQLKSHSVSMGSYKPWLGRSLNWRRKGRYKKDIKNAKAMGPGGFCVCPKCNYKIKHKAGVPCASLKCPKCNSRLTRK